VACARSARQRVARPLCLYFLSTLIVAIFSDNLYTIAAFTPPSLRTYTRDNVLFELYYSYTHRFYRVPLLKNNPLGKMHSNSENGLAL
jgi:hypothetical protein